MARKGGGRKRVLGTRTAMPGRAQPNDRWSLDIVSDQFVSGRRFRILAIYADCTRECQAAVAGVSLSGCRVARALDILIAARGRPRAIVSDNATELTSSTILERFTTYLNRWGFCWIVVCDSRCWLDWRPASDGPTSFQ